jgi:hypothetical protein
MSGFDEREKGFEKKFAHDEETRFKIVARRNRLLGLWAAERMGLGKAEADAYAKEVVAADFEEAGEEDIYRKIAADLKKRGVDMSEHRIRKQMEELAAEASKQVLGK